MPDFNDGPEHGCACRGKHVWMLRFMLVVAWGVFWSSWSSDSLRRFGSESLRLIHELPLMGQPSCN